MSFSFEIMGMPITDYESMFTQIKLITNLENVKCHFSVVQEL